MSSSLTGSLTKRPLHLLASCSWQICALPESTQRRHSKYLSFPSLISSRNASFASESSCRMAGHHGQGYFHPHSQAQWTPPSAPASGVARTGYPSQSCPPTLLDSRSSLYSQDDPSHRTLVYTIERRGTPKETSQLLVPPFPNAQRRSTRSPDVSYAQRLYASSLPKQRKTSSPPQGTHSSDGFVHSPPPPSNVHRPRHTNSPRVDRQVESLSRAFSSEFHVSPPPPPPPAPAPPVADRTGKGYPVTPPSDYHEEISKSSKMASFDYGASSSSAFQIPEDYVPVYEIPISKEKPPKIPEEPIPVIDPPPPPAESSIERPRSIPPPPPPPQTDPVASVLSTEEDEEAAEEAPPYTLVDEIPPPPSVEDTPTETEPREPHLHPITAPDATVPRAPAYTAAEVPSSRSPVEPPPTQSRLSYPDSTVRHRPSSALDDSLPRAPAYTAVDPPSARSPVEPLRADNPARRHASSTLDDSLPRAPACNAVGPPHAQRSLSPTADSTRRMHGPRRLSSASTFSTAPSVVSGIATDLYGSAYGFRPQREHTLPQATHPNPVFTPPPAMHSPTPVYGNEMAGHQSGSEFPIAPPMTMLPQHAPHHIMPGHHFPQPQYAPDGRPLSFNATAPPVNYHPPPEWQKGPQTCPSTYTSPPPPHSILDPSSPHTVPQHYPHPVSPQTPHRLQKRQPGPNRPSTAPSVPTLTPAERWAQQPPMPQPW